MPGIVVVLLFIPTDVYRFSVTVVFVVEEGLVTLPVVVE